MRLRHAPLAAACAAALLPLAGCASGAEERIRVQPYKVVLLPVEGAAEALSAPQPAKFEGEMVPLSLTPSELEKTVFDRVKAAGAFTELVDAPESVRATRGAFAGDELAAAADFAQKVRADLILRVTVKSARIRDLGNNSSTFWSSFVWFMVPLPVWGVDDRTYETSLAVEAALYEPRDTVKPTASVVAASGRHDLDLWDRGLSPYVFVVPPAFLRGDDRSVSEKVTQLAVDQVLEKLAAELRDREIPARFELDVTARDRAIDVVVSARRQLRSLEVVADGKPVKAWAETELVAEKDSTADRRVYRRSVDVPAAAAGRTEVRVIAEDESGGREVRTIVLGRKR